MPAMNAPPMLLSVKRTAARRATRAVAASMSCTHARAMIRNMLSPNPWSNLEQFGVRMGGRDERQYGRENCQDRASDLR